MEVLRNDITKVKEINIEFIKSALKSLGTATKAQIAEETGISVATCGKILNELCQSREVLESDTMAGSYGRPAKSYVYNGNYALVAGVYAEADRGQIKLSLIVSNLVGEVQEEYAMEYQEMNSEIIEKALEELVDKYPKIKAIAVGIPGYITDGVIGICNFSSLMGIPLREQLEKKFSDIHIVVENDMNAAVYGFYQNSQLRNATIAFLYSPDKMDAGPKSDGSRGISAEQEKGREIGLTFGAGFVADGRILRGSTGYAGEVSFLPALRGKNPQSVEERLEMAALVIESIVPILNPGTIALSGSFFNQANMRQIEQQCLKSIEPYHMPQIILREDLHKDYVDGLIYLALEELTCEVTLIERQV
ncbi:MAG: ROK family protein [Ruminococcus sp.]